VHIYKAANGEHEHHLPITKTATGQTWSYTTTITQEPNNRTQ